VIVDTCSFASIFVIVKMCMFTCTHLSVPPCKVALLFVCVRAVCLCVRAFVYLCVCVCVCVCACLCMCANVYLHTYM